jgi:hypothetical protein
VVQATTPVWQGLPFTEQALPAVHATQAPPLQTMFSPQTVPFACGCWVSVHDATPSEQVVCPTWQALPSGQAPPETHDGASRPPSVVTWLPPEPPRPVPPEIPPVPVSPGPLSGKTGCSRRLHPIPAHPNSTVITSSRRDIVSP